MKGYGRVGVGIDVSKRRRREGHTGHSLDVRSRVWKEERRHGGNTGILAAQEGRWKGGFLLGLLEECGSSRA